MCSLFFSFSHPWISFLVQVTLNSKYMYKRDQKKIKVNGNSKRDFVATLSTILIEFCLLLNAYLV